jgi:drug/metabolite transporter (DMT)-like permease
LTGSPYRVGFVGLLASPYLLLALAALSWSGNHVLGRAVHSEIPPLALAYWRWFIASMVLLPFVARQAWEYRAVVRRHWRLLVLLAALGMSINHGLLYLALNSTTAINVGLINATAPMIFPMISFLAYRELLSRRQVFGIAVSLVGVVIIISRADLTVLLGLHFTPGDLYMLGSMVVWAMYSVFLKRLPPGLPPMVFLLVLCIIGTILLFPFYGWELAVRGGFAVNVPNFLTLAYIGIFPSALAFICWNQGVAQIGANKAGLFNYLIPVFTVGLAVALLGEVVHAYHAAGAVLAVIGIYLTTTARRPAPG